MSTLEVIANLKSKAGPNGVIISSSMMEHFSAVVMPLMQLGADRQGSQVMLVNGDNCIVDKYILSDGTLILAGYAQ